MAARRGGAVAPLALALALTLVLSVAGCSDASSAAGGPAGSTDDPDPAFTVDARAALAALHYDDGPPPADPSNQVADNIAARAFGQRLFFETAFSGRLLEGDNDGSSATLGKQGEAGRISCAGCHVPHGG